MIPLLREQPPWFLRFAPAAEEGWAGEGQEDLIECRPLVRSDVVLPLEWEGAQTVRRQGLGPLYDPAHELGGEQAQNQALS